jgi:hypothetical protein
LSTQTNERACETQVEETLLGIAGWQRGSVAESDLELALFDLHGASGSMVNLGKPDAADLDADGKPR